MATGPEHYREAEKLTTLAAQNGWKRPDLAAEYLAAAQVHATLALAAATAFGGALSSREWQEWDEVAGTPRPSPEPDGNPCGCGDHADCTSTCECADGEA